MSPALSGSSAIRCFEGTDAIEIRDGITFEFYTGLPQAVYTGTTPVIDHTPKATLLCSKIVPSLSFFNTVMIRMGGGSDLG